MAPTSQSCAKRLSRASQIDHILRISRRRPQLRSPQDRFDFVASRSIEGDGKAERLIVERTVRTLRPDQGKARR